MSAVAPGSFKITPYLANKKCSILTLKWLGYFPIQSNRRLTDFRLSICSGSFILHLLRAFVILFFFICSRVSIIDPTLEAYTPFAKNNTENNSTRNKSTSYEVSTTYQFSSLTEYFNIIYLLLYVAVLTTLCKKFATFLTKFCHSVHVMGELLGTPIPNSTGAFWKLYTGLFFQLLPIAISQGIETIYGILDHDWWRETSRQRIDTILQSITYGWLYMTMSVFEMILTVSIKAIRDHLKAAQMCIHDATKQQLILQNLIEVLDNFQLAFGGILTLNLSYYTIDCMTDTFYAIIFAAAKNFIATLIYVLLIIGLLFKLYNIASGCDLLAREIEEYVDYLNDGDARMQGHALGRKVSFHLEQILYF